MYNITGSIRYNLTEAEQSNPLRWELLLNKGNGNFEVQTAKFKCKDYLNDLVAKYHDVDVVVYGFDTKKITLEAEGSYFRLTNIVNRDILIKNLAVICSATPEGTAPLQLEPLDDKKSGLLFIPRWYFSSTYIISLTSYLIRIACLGEEFTSFDAIWDTKAKETDNAINYNYKETIRKWGFNVPEKFTKYWYYSGKSYNSEDCPKPESYMGSTLHNNGACAWVMYAK